MQVNSLPSEPPGNSRNTGVACLSSPVNLPYPGIKLGSAALQGDSLPAALLGKPTNMGIYIYIYIYMTSIHVYVYNTYDVMCIMCVYYVIYYVCVLYINLMCCVMFYVMVNAVHSFFLRK